MLFQRFGSLGALSLYDASVPQIVARLTVTLMMTMQFSLCRAVPAMICLCLGLMLSPFSADAQSVTPERSALMIARLVAVIPDIADQAGNYTQLRSDILNQWDAVPAGLIGENGLSVPWANGNIGAAPFGDDNALARLHLTNVPQDICVELGFLTLDQARVAGFYINGSKLDQMPPTLGAFMISMAATCTADPSMIDIIMR